MKFRIDPRPLVLMCAVLLFTCAPCFAQEPEAGDFSDEIHDPLEPINRRIFWFNDQLDIYLLEPVASAYDEVIPQGIQRGIGNFFTNLRYPSYLVSDVVQLKFKQACEHTARFLLNSTAGVGGIFDLAADIGLPDHEEDFGTGLAYNGVPPGPYIVIPLLGPSNLRDAFGRIVDSFLTPTYYLGSYTDLSRDEALGAALGLRAVDLIDQRAGLLEAIEAAKESSLDYYLFTQSAFYQHRRGVIYDGDPPEGLVLE